MTPFKTLILENDFLYLAVKVLAIVGSVACLGVIAVLSLEAVEKFRGIK